MIFIVKYLANTYASVLCLYSFPAWFSIVLVCAGVTQISWPCLLQDCCFCFQDVFGRCISSLKMRCVVILRFF